MSCRRSWASPVHRAAILAAGEGSRLAASGVATPKPLVDVGGEPMIVRLARQLRDTGARDTVALVHPRAAAAVRLLDEAGLDVHVRLRDDTGLLPQPVRADARLAGEPFLLCLVDSVFEHLPSSALRARGGRFPRCGARRRHFFVHDEAPLRVLVGIDGRVTAIGTPQAASSRWVTAGVYWFGEGVADASPRRGQAGSCGCATSCPAWSKAGLDVRAHDLGRVVDVDTAADVALPRAPGAAGR